MEFPLLKLPFLAIQEVLLQLQFHEIIEFSFCSIRSKRLIQSMRRHRYKAVQISSNNSNQQIFLETGERTGDIWWFSLPFERRELVAPGEIRKIGSTEIRFQKNGDVIASKLHPTSPIKVVYEYLQELFKHLPIGKFSCRPTRTHGSLFPDYFGITKCRELHLYDYTTIIPKIQLKYILEKVQVQKCLDLSYDSNQDFRMDPSVKLSTDYINAGAGWMLRDTFLSLDCTRLHLRNVNLTTKDFEDFVRKWLSSSSTRLIWMKCFFEEQNYPFDFSRFQTISWDSNVRGKWFGMRHVYPLMGGLRMYFSHGMDITRAHDGLMATILCHPNSFHFVVWHERFHDYGNIPENQLMIC